MFSKMPLAWNDDSKLQLVRLLRPETRERAAEMRRQVARRCGWSFRQR
jgi:hypothetical protein